MGHDLGGHAHSDALGTEQQEHGQLGGQRDRLLHASVIGINKLGQVLVKQGLAGQRGQAAFDITGR